jgi:hypothetical protein
VGFRHGEAGGGRALRQDRAGRIRPGPVRGPGLSHDVGGEAPLKVFNPGGLPGAGGGSGAPCVPGTGCAGAASGAVSCKDTGSTPSSDDGNTDDENDEPQPKCYKTVTVCTSCRTVLPTPIGSGQCVYECTYVDETGASLGPNTSKWIQYGLPTEGICLPIPPTCSSQEFEVPCPDEEEQGD